jgi:hypothetical protein
MGLRHKNRVPQSCCNCESDDEECNYWHERMGCHACMTMT